MHSLPLADIQLTDTFWSRWQNLLLDVTLPTQFTQLVETGRLSNFEKAAAKAGEFEGLWFNDSDIYKFAEACAYALTIREAPKVRECLNTVIQKIQAAQEPDGYINTYFQLGHPDMKWRNLNMMHEMYCGGHLIEAGVAVFECLGDRRLLDVSIRFADHVASVFGPGKRLGYCGHEEIELALLELSRVTGNATYRDLARWMVESRGSRPSPYEAELLDPDACSLWPGTGSLLVRDGHYIGEYSQDHAPIRDHTQVVGHAVRAMYFYIAAAELADGTSDEALEAALVRCWDNLTQKRMYVTGGIGPSASNEGFTADYDLPNLSAYAETCASCGLVFWGRKMLELTGNSEYADIVERALYNGVLSGISLSGDHYFYANPLESRGTHKRTPWFFCACCPPNIARLIGSLGRYVASVSDDRFYIHIPTGFRCQTTIADSKAGIEVESDYPWSGKVIIRFKLDVPVRFKLFLRIPEWSENMEVDLPGADEPADYDNGYAVYDRTWAPSDVLKVDFGMNPVWVEANPKVRENLGRVALSNGPLIYTAEECDLGFAPQLFAANTDATITVGKTSGLPGLQTLTVEGFAEIEDDEEALYPSEGSIACREVSARFVPYYAWNNRGANSMQVWVRKA